MTPMHLAPWHWVATVLFIIIGKSLSRSSIITNLIDVRIGFTVLVSGFFVLLFLHRRRRYVYHQQMQEYYYEQVG